MKETTLPSFLKAIADAYLEQAKDKTVSPYDRYAGFVDGFRKHQDSIWHETSKELPEKYRYVLASTLSPPGRGLMDGGYAMVTERSMLEMDRGKKNPFKAWAYLTDILPPPISFPTAKTISPTSRKRLAPSQTSSITCSEIINKTLRDYLHPSQKSSPQPSEII